ncbi:hypothetical protein DYBT9275_05803 [Dyadobacter sp. CECT 9275]|uniref:FAD-binding domain-containing protein n=1 Tax=Dyadobacter helix TaxID=2822344 RepID=A0A916JIH8_9BACT|nr:FAD-dependent monooxygenase [Dyadobacter sp. CECT 9275]CAG5017579.1 hypothetical protein DYBT9275_05803 [Dyadobacter sp. CECT 9275]
METEIKKYDCAIIGGGLGGLCLAIQLADAGVSVVLFEKKRFPFHKVCGEYISMESWGFIEKLGVPLRDMSLPRITELGISSEKGFMLNRQLEPGGFGISRYTLDQKLYEKAISKGVNVVEGAKVNGIEHQDGIWEIETSSGKFRADITCGSYGKYTPSFVQQLPGYEDVQKAGKPNYIGVKYHVRTDLNVNRIELHNFRDGYCGISRVDGGRYCMCYLTSSKNLHDFDMSIKTMEEQVLYKNPFLKRYFTGSDFLFSQPLVVSNVEFHKKQTEVNGMFLLGDAAGSITPLCGNGMSMAMRSSQLLGAELIGYFRNKTSRDDIADRYQVAWNRHFGTRIRAGYYLQYLFGKRTLTDISLRLLNQLPQVTDRFIALTHGDNF